MNLNRKAAVFGFTLLISDIILMAAGLSFAPPVFAVTVITTVIFCLKKDKKAYFFLLVTAAFVFALITFGRQYTKDYLPESTLDVRHAQLTGTVSSPMQNGTFTLSDCTVNGKKTASKIILYSAHSAGVSPGDRIECEADSLSCNADSKSNFFFHSLSDRTWLSAVNYSSVNVTGRSSSPYYLLVRLRERADNKLFFAFGEESYPLITALLTGDQSAVPEKTKQEFRLSGVSHIFAVSGMHLTIWTGLLYFFFGRHAKIRKFGNTAVLLFIIAFCVFTGLSPSVLRAGIMQFTVTLGNLFKKKADPLNSLGLSAAVLLGFDPFLAGNVSFLLSFLACFAIVGIFPLMQTESRPKDKRLLIRNTKKSVSALSLSAVILFATLPLTAFFFGYISLLSPVTGLICTPLAELTMTASSLAFFLPVNTGFFRPYFAFCDFLSGLLAKIISFFAGLDFALFPLRRSYVAVWFTLSLLVFIIVFLKAKDSRKNVIVFLISLIALVITGTVSSALNAYTTELFIPSAGNSTCFTLTRGDGNNCLIVGCGGTYRSVRRTREYLLSKTVVSPDTVLFPRNAAPENSRADDICSFFAPKTVLEPSFGETPLSVSAETILADRYSSVLWSGTALTYESTSDFCAGIITVNGYKIVFTSLPGAELSSRGEDYSNGDLLICRGNLPPDAERLDFERTVVLSDHTSKGLGLPPDAVSTADGELIITLK